MEIKIPFNDGVKINYRIKLNLQHQEIRDMVKSVIHL
jgi:hypothetical protein